MKQFVAFVRKEFYHIVRDSRTMLILLGMPIVQMLLFGFAINMEVKDIRVAIVDPTPSTTTRAIAERIEHNNNYAYQGYASSLTEVESLLRKDQLDLAVVFEPNFSQHLTTREPAHVQLISNGSDPNRGTIAANYAQGVISTYLMAQAPQIPYSVDVESRMLYNPEMESAYMFVPGIMGLVLMIICTLMTSVSIIREKERGTMEVLLASPLNQYTVIFAKTIPYLTVSVINFLTILVLSYFVLGVPFNGSFVLLLFIALLYIFMSLMLGLLISTVVDKQINAIIMSGIGIILPVLVLSGMIFPIDNMPAFLQYLSYVVPARWFIAAVRKVMIQGQGIGMVWQEILFLVTTIAILLSATLSNTKKRLE